MLARSGSITSRRKEPRISRRRPSSIKKETLMTRTSFGLCMRAFCVMDAALGTTFRQYTWSKPKERFVVASFPSRSSSMMMVNDEGFSVPSPSTYVSTFLSTLELISYCFRALSLGIRLFANMMYDHSLVKILSGFAWTMLFLNNIFYFIGYLGPLFIVLALAAHVCTISICIYLNDATNLHQNESFHN
ncbi:hypothetical protein ZWY2020_014283 [Hordeum vulgare]|nr:hypothetical protein ZWY2020_014283 [Hordeum vulgare]